jgi:DNA recombination protein RmuC
MNDWIMLVVGVAVGAAVVWLWAWGRNKAAESLIQELRAQKDSLQAGLNARVQDLADLQQQVRKEGEQKVVAQTKLEQAQASLEEQKRSFEETRAKLEDAFKALSAEALKSNNQVFLDLAKTRLETIQAEARGDLETRQQAIDALVGPLRESLQRYEAEIRKIETSRLGAYVELQEQVRALAGASQQLQKEAGGLANALRGGPQVRGRWGEMTLRRAAELTGMSEYCDFSQQETLMGESGRSRPDMIVKLPGVRRIAVDAKAPLQAFLDAAAATSEEERAEHLARHGALVRDHLKKLAKREYWDQLGEDQIEMVVMFLPAESFLSAALEQDRTLIEDGVQERVILATPTILIALLLAVAHGWTQEKRARHAEEISKLGKDVYDRLGTFVGHFVGIGASLKKALENYGKAASSLESRVLIAARKFKDLGAATGEEIPLVEPVDSEVRLREVGEQEESAGGESTLAFPADVPRESAD